MDFSCFGYVANEFKNTFDFYVGTLHITTLYFVTINVRIDVSLLIILFHNL